MFLTATNKATSLLLVIVGSFLELSGLIGLMVVLFLFLVFLLVKLVEVLLHHIGSRRLNTFPISFALALSSTSRIPMSSSTLNSCLLCLREVANSF